MPLADDGPEVRELPAKLSEPPRQPLILTLRWRFVFDTYLSSVHSEPFFSCRIILLVMVLLLLPR